MKAANEKKGSALIMTIVLTVLLAIVGTLFVLMARTEKVATSARSENEELKLAAESIVGTISQKLTDDVPQNYESNRYYDYPGRWDTAGNPHWLDSNDCWLANLEPEKDVTSGVYQWRHISDIYNTFGTNAYNMNIVQGGPNGDGIIPDYPKDINAANYTSRENYADADGDGVADSRWVEVPQCEDQQGKAGLCGCADRR